MSHQTKSPFEDPIDPFLDPSITSALQSGQSPEQESSFDDTAHHHVPASHDPYDSQGTDFNAREEALRERERELANRERALDERQRQTAKTKGPNNFPPCLPVMYFDISVEIPPEHQSTVWWIYREWLLFEITLVLNFIACLCVLFSHPASVTSAPTDLGIALTEMFTHTAASFFLWYRPVYNAYMKEVSLYYYFFFVFNGFHILYTIYMAVGIPSTGGAGLILLVTLFTEGFIVSGIFTLLASIGWIVMGFMALILYKKTYSHYRAAGHTFNEAKNDALVHMGRSETVRNAAVNAAWHSATTSR